MGQKKEYTGGFSDIPGNLWCAEYVQAAYENGWVNGVSENSFAPDEAITRQDAAAIVYRVMHSRNISFDMSQVQKFSDSNDISDYALVAVNELSSGGIIKGADGRFLPKNNITRAEACAICFRVSEYIGEKEK